MGNSKITMSEFLRRYNTIVTFAVMVVLAAVMAYVPVTFIRAYKTDAGNVQAVTGVQAKRFQFHGVAFLGIGLNVRATWGIFILKKNSSGKQYRQASYAISLTRCSDAGDAEPLHSVPAGRRHHVIQACRGSKLSHAPGQGNCPAFSL